jgi:hypothetical protein
MFLSALRLGGRYPISSYPRNAEGNTIVTQYYMTIDCAHVHRIAASSPVPAILLVFVLVISVAMLVNTHKLADLYVLALAHLFPHVAKACKTAFFGELMPEWSSQISLCAASGVRCDSLCDARYALSDNKEFTSARKTRIR